MQSHQISGVENNQSLCSKPPLKHTNSYSECLSDYTIICRAIKSLESRITSHPDHQPGGDQERGRGGEGERGGGGEGEEEKKEGRLTLIKAGPPNWTQYQRQTHKYEDIEILDDQLVDEYLSGHKGPLRGAQGNAMSVGNLHMAWDDSDTRCV